MTTEGSRMRMLEFKTSEKNLENCIISRRSKQNWKLERVERKFTCDRANKELSK
jgi:hypothetical protein